MAERTLDKQDRGSAAARRGCFRRFLFLFLVLSQAASAGCFSPRDPCIKGGEVGKSYLAHLDEVYDESVTDVLFQSSVSRTETSCMAFDGLMPGVDIGFTILAAQAGVQTCVTHYATVSVPSVQALGPHTGLAGSNDVELDVALFQQSGTVGACSGAMEIDFRSRGDPSLPKSAGSPPPFLVDRYFMTSDAAACPAFGVPSGYSYCADTWVATLVPQ